MFSLFGKSIVAARIIGTLLYAVVLFLTHQFVRRGFRDWGPLVPLAVLTVATSIGAGLNLASWPGFAMSLVALLSYLHAQNLSRNRLPAIAISGLLTAAAILYRVNFGGYVAMVAAADILLQWWLQGQTRWTRGHLKSVVATLAAYGVPLVAGCAGFCLWVYGSHAGQALIEFVVTAQRLMSLRGFITLRYSLELACAAMLPSAWFFFRILRGADELPVKAFVAAGFAIANLLVLLVCANRPSVAFIGLAVEFGSVVFLHMFVKRLERSELNVLLYFCCLLHYYFGRADWAHWRWLPVVAAMLLPYLLFQRYNPAEREAESRAPRGTALAGLLTATLLLAAAGDLRPHASWTQNGVRLLTLRIYHPRAADSDLVVGAAAASPGWDTVYTDPTELAALRYLRARSDSTDPVFVGVQDHSRIFWNDLRMYWLADRPIGTRTFQLETRVATEAAVQREIIADLKRNHVKWAVLDCVAVRGDDTFTEQAYQGSTLLDQYMKDHFQEEARFGRYAVLSRAGELADKN